MKWNAKRLNLVFYVASLFILFSCKKLVEVDPPSTSINSGNVFANDVTAIAAVTDIYVTMSEANLTGGGIASLNLLPSLSADELSLVNGATNYGVHYYYQNALTSTNLFSTDFWFSFYNVIYITNAAIEGLTKSNTLTADVKTQLLGEAKFIRALCYFHLVNLYGDVPFAVSTDYNINSTLSRSAKALIYKHIITDLKEAQNLLSTQYLNATLLSATAERIRPTKWAATALLAKVYMYYGNLTSEVSNFVNAEAQSSLIINNTTLFDTVSLNAVFIKNSKEAIWQLQPVHAGWNTEIAKTFILPSNGPDPFSFPFCLSATLLNSFETNDQRKANWIKSVTVGNITYSYPYKYKSAIYNDPVTEYTMVFRVAEQYLIRAEAKAQQNKMNEAKEDLNVIRRRAGLTAINVNDKSALLAAILKERQVELFTEWGNRWFDLKRTGSVDAVMGLVTPQKGGSWNTNWQWYPISKNELLLNPALVQNAGY